MDDRNPDNLKLLYNAFGEQAIEGILPGDSFTVDGVEFVCKYTTGSTADRFFIVKNLDLVQRYREVCQRFAGGNIVELGIAEGGGAAFIALVAQPRHLVAVDLEPIPLAALTEFIERRELGDSVHTHYGVDQSDRARLGAVVDASLSGEPIDVLFDDCSHKYGPTRASFECLFPRMAPGGLYIIEDWNADHVFRDSVARILRDPSAPLHEQTAEAMRRAMSASPPAPQDDPVPLTRLAMELAVARCAHTDLITRVSLDEFWIVVERGPAEIEPDSFHLDDHCHDYFGFLPPLPTDASSSP